MLFGITRTSLLHCRSRWSNTIQSLHVLLDALPELSLTLLPRNVEAASYIQDLSPDDWIPTSIDRKVLMTLVADPAVQEAISECSAVIHDERS